MQSGNKERLKVAKTFIVVAMLAIYQMLADTDIPEEIATNVLNIADKLNKNLNANSFLYSLSPSDELVEHTLRQNYEVFEKTIQTLQLINTCYGSHPNISDESGK